MEQSHLSADYIREPSGFAELTKGHRKPVLDCCFSPDTDQLLTVSEDSLVVLWNFPPLEIELHDETMNDEHKLVCYRLSGHEVPVHSVAWQKQLCLSAGKDGKVKLWRLTDDPNSSAVGHRRNLKRIIPDPSTYTCHQRIVRSVCFAPDALYFASGSDDNCVKIWSTECRNKSLVSLPDGHKNWVKCVRWSKTNDSLLASCGHDGRICVWDARTKVRQSPIISMKKNSPANCLDWHPVFSHHIATGSLDGACTIWDLRNKKPVQVYMDHDKSVDSLAFNPGGSILLSGSQDKTSRIFDVCEGRTMFKLISHRAPVTSVCFNFDGEFFATTSLDNRVTIWKRNFDVVDIVLDDGSDEQEDSYTEIVSEPGSRQQQEYHSNYYQSNFKG